jgi:hypothetical protein
MGRGDQDKRERRARDQIDKALARRDLESAVDAVLAVDKTAREPLLALVSPAFRQTLSDLQKTAAWARLHTLAARAEQEPRLLSHEGDEAGVASARWPLFLACMRARDFARAGRMWKFLVDKVTARAPALARAIAAWQSGQGQVDPHAVAGMDLDGLPALAVPDPRLGIDSHARPRLAPPAAPVSSAQAEEALFILFATQPLTVVADTLRTWVDRAPAELALTLRKQAGSLAMRELLVHASSRKSLALPAQLLARLSEGAEDDLAKEIVLATRLLLTRVVSKTQLQGEYESLADLAAALVRTTQFKDVAETLAREFGRVPGLASLAISICQSALARAASMSDEHLFPLWIQMLHLNAPPPEAEPEDRFWFPGPTWLQAASREVCKRGKSLAAYLDKLDPHDRAKMLDSLLWGQPSEIVADIMDALWKDASEEVRRELAHMLPDLVEMAEEDSQNMFSSGRSSADMAAVDRITLAISKADPDLPFLAAGGLSLWRRFGLRLLPYFVELLPYALSQANQPSQRMEAVKAYVGNRVDIEAWLEAIRELSMGDAKMLPALIVETSQAMLDRFRTDRIALARAIEYTVKFDMPRFDVPFSLLKTLAHAYQRAALADGAEPTPEDERAQGILGLMFGTMTKKPRAKGRAKRRSKTPRKPEPQSSGSQLELPLDENDP